ncbi:MAG: uracil-DNA glycosylase [Bacteroidetes bacterium]|jgi:hypothetical protein|nr:uracil-DNA glycosylase [Bacteroidota bacterium]
MIDDFIDSLKNSPKPLFNPWYHQDKEHDMVPNAPEIRREQLRTYLKERVDRAKYLFIAEALGYQGGHFTGIAMTSERILLGHQEEKYGVNPSHVFKKRKPLRTSRPDLIEKGMSEPTATIMWGALIDMEMDSYETVLWNALPWHPYNPDKGLLSNRTPTGEELAAGIGLLKRFLKIFADAKVIAVGRKCEASLAELSVDCSPVRHPANGGAPKFRKQVKSLL